MQTGSNEIYEALKAKLAVDPADLDHILLDQPQYIQAISENVAVALKERDEATNELKFQIADEADHLRSRSDKKPAEKQIETDVLLAKTVIEAQQNLINASYNYSLWRGLMDAAKAREESIATYAKLWMAGYLTTNTVYSQRREELAERRAERAPIKHSRDKD